LSPEASPVAKEPIYEVNEPLFGLVSIKSRLEELPMSLLYASENPASVILRFNPDADEPNDWEFSRRTLARGFFEPHGVGDVHVEPWDDGKVLIQLNHRKAPKTQVILDRSLVQEFLDQSYETVPARKEEAMIMNALDAWLTENMPVIPAPVTAATNVEEVSV
jgi:hypothetical protein